MGSLTEGPPAGAAERVNWNHIHPEASREKTEGLQLSHPQSSFAAGVTCVSSLPWPLDISQNHVL